MKRIYFILPLLQPFPAVNGGAVETLLNMFINENEKIGIYDITVFSIYNVDAEAISNGYKYTKVKYFKIDNQKLSIGKFAQIMRDLMGDNNSDYVNLILNEINKDKLPELCIVEGGNYREYKKISRLIGKNRMALHVHSLSTPRFNANNLYDNFIFPSFAAKKCWEAKRSCNGFVLFNAVDEQIFKTKIEQNQYEMLRRKYEISEDDFVILYCGRLDEEKGILELIKAVKLLKYSNIKLLVVGSSWFKDSVYTSYQMELEKEIDDNIIFTGYVDNHLMYQYYQICDVVASPTLTSEAGSLVNIEVMMSGRPLITTSQGANREYVSPNGAIMIDYNGDKEELVNKIKLGIETLYGNPDLSEKMGCFNLQHSNSYSSANYFQEYRSIIDRIIDDLR